MTASELLIHCQNFKEEHGMLVLCDVLETIFDAADQAGCIEILDEDDEDDLDEIEGAYFTVQ